MGFSPLPIDLLDYRDRLKVRGAEGFRQVWDPVRRRYVAWTPEEMVRQLLIQYLTGSGKTGLNRLSVEREFLVAGRRRRYDLVIHDGNGHPVALAECKRPGVRIDQATLDQAGRYNLSMQVPCLILSNGPTTWCLVWDAASRHFTSVGEIPHFLGN